MNNLFSGFVQSASAYTGARSAPRPGPNARRSGMSEQAYHQNNGCTTTPPASERAIRQLPTVSVTQEDLIDENNRACCICFDDLHLGEKVARLPCAHIYHTSCITEWLQKNCTCPVCRYELPTDDSCYETGRLQRMAQRKPRFAKYDLQRLSGKELRDLCIRLNIPIVALEKNEIVDLVANSGKIDLITTPNPIEYESIEILRAMGIGQLKKAMTHAGVFFDPKFVIEKEDMVQIFVNSGRLVFIISHQEQE